MHATQRSFHTRPLHLDLEDAPGRFDVHWIDIATGEWGKRETLDGGRKVTVTAPATGHWVAGIVKAGTASAAQPSEGPLARPSGSTRRG